MANMPLEEVQLRLGVTGGDISPAGGLGSDENEE